MKKLEKSLEETQKEQEKVAEILIVVEELFEREDDAFKRIVGCLYDIATINWINQNVSNSTLNSLLKYIAPFPRSLAKNLALQLFLQPKCPQLITNWLYSKVQFLPKDTPLDLSVAPQPIVPSEQEIRKLRHQVRLLTGSLVLSIFFASGTIVWLLQKNNLHQLRLQPTVNKQLSR